MKLLCSPTLSAVLFALATLPTPLVFAQAEPVNVTTAPPLRFTVAPGVESPIVMKTLPNAVCGLHQEPARDTEPSMKLYADADSTIRIHVKAKHASGESQLFAIDCAANGQIVRFPLELRAAPAPILDMPLPQASVAPPKGAYVRPALADEDAQQLSDEQLLKRDYPPRPDATKSPKVYAAWLKTVSKPATFIAAQTVSVPGISHKRRSKIQTDGADSYNWSGYQLQSRGRTYDLVLGIWYVPALDSEIVFFSASSFWLGLDGLHTDDLVQAGTSQENIDFGNIGFNIYFAWSELLPNQPTEQRITNVPINPTDEIESQVWIGDVNGAINQNGGYAWFYLQDFNNLQYVYFNTPLNGTYFTGSEAEWIMERPLLNSRPTELADYGLAGMWSAYALTTNWDWVAYSAAPRSFHVQRQQLLAESQIFQNEVLTGTESTDNPTEKMAKSHDHGPNFTGTRGTPCCTSDSFRKCARF